MTIPVNAQGLNISKIADGTGMRRETVRKVLSGDDNVLVSSVVKVLDFLIPTMESCEEDKT